MEVRCRRYDHKEVGGTRPWMVEGRTMQEQLSRVAPGAATENYVRNTTPGKEELE